jgi:phosphoglycolate phosphatase-like HAD superfamily hydrolase
VSPDHPILGRRRELENRQSPPWVALFDIDSTLMDTTPRHAAILDAAFDGVPGFGRWRGRVAMSSSEWNLIGSMERAGVDPALRTAVEAFWKERFFDNGWVGHDTPYPGVPEFLRELKAEGFRLVYLTGRHETGMAAGTRRSFEAHGLPAGPDEVFLFKPTFEENDHVFKAAACARVAALGSVVVSVDNEPANVNLFQAAFPEALNVWLKTITSPHPEALRPGIARAAVSMFLEPVPRLTPDPKAE